MNKNYVDYGIDAPGVIRSLFFAGAIELIVGLFLWYRTYFAISVSFLITSIDIITVAAFFLIIAALINIICAAFMIFSSKIGKHWQARYLIDSFNLKGNEQILDIGCGRGLILIEAAKRLHDNGKATGVDIWSLEDLSENSKHAVLKNAELENVKNRIIIQDADARSLPFSDNSFDIVVSSMMLHNIPNTEGRNAAIAHMLRVLKIGGILAIQDFQYTSEYEKELQSLGYKVKKSNLSWYIFPPVRIVKIVKNI